MKLLSLIAFILASNLSFARSLQTQETHILTQVVADGVQTEFVAELHADYTHNKMRIDIYRDICGTYSRLEGEITCLAMPVLVRRIETNIEKSELSCGSSVVSGTNQNLNKTGTILEIVYMNHTHRVCKDIRPGKFEVQIEIYDLLTKKTSHLLLVKP